MFVKNASRVLSAVLVITLSILMITSLFDNKAEGGKDDYTQITPQEAKEIIDTQSDYVILDVRTDEEYAQSHISDAILIPDYEIRTRAEKELTDKNQLILVYCRSGRRSKNAAAELVSLGYANVKEFGGILDWPYETITN